MLSIIGNICIMLFLGVIALIIKLNHDVVKEDKENNVIFSDVCKYIGGISELDEKDFTVTTVKLQVRPQNLFVDNRPFNTIEIPLKNILEIKVKSKSQIQQEISTGKLLCFGALALGMKNETVNTQSFLIVKYKDVNNEDITFAVETQYAENFNKEIKKQRGEKYVIDINNVINN